MTKAEISRIVAGKTGITPAEAQNVIEAFMSAVKDSLAGGEAVYLRGFGSFVLKRRATKTARDIKMNKTIIVPEHDIPHFKPADVFTKALLKEVI